MWAKKTKIHVIEMCDEDGIVEKKEPLDDETIPNHGRGKNTIGTTLEEDPKGVGARPKGCAGVLFSGFADDVGISGVKFVVGKSVVPLRRILWLMVLLSGTSVMSYQIWERLSYYLSFPFNVNVEVDYVDRLTFPAVAICNYNKMAKSTTDKYGITDLISGMYATYAPDFDKYRDRLNLTASEEFYEEAAHAPEGMFFFPTWKLLDVDLDSLETIFTDFGVCYAFNTGKDGIRQAENTGKSFGFSVHLEAASWDYNIGPEYGVGFQIMLYDQGDVPLVGDLGFSVSVGEEVRVGVEVTRVVNLPPPHGVCSDKSLTYHSKYTINACRLECLTSHVVKTCGCRLYYMPGNTTVCDLEEAYYCAAAAMAVYVNQSSSCECPVPCSRVIYKPSLSHAKFPSRPYSSYVAQVFSINPARLSDNIAKLNIFFKELTVTEIKQEKAYDIFGLLCDIGGALGLWLGGSILTVMEIVDICLKGCCNRSWH